MQIDNYELKKNNEAKLHRLTLQENDARLSTQHDDIRNGLNIEVLEPFAKAYLGLFLEIDSSFPPEQRIHFIASEELADAVMHGLRMALNNIKNLPSLSDIGQAMVVDERMELGYVVLASMDLLTKKHKNIESVFKKIKPEVLSAALCFHYANSNNFQNKWLADLIKYQPDLVTKTLQIFWRPQMNTNGRYLPGLQELLKTPKGQQLVGDIILPILEGWSGYKKKSINILLGIALRYANKEKLLFIINNILDTDKILKPRMKIIWLTSAFIIKPDCYWQQMQDYTYRSKEKLLPLLDFSVALLDEITLELDSLTKIIRLIAPKFPPHIDDFGALAANPQKTLRLFYELGNREESIAAEIKWLRSVRVMKIVSPILNVVEILNKEKIQTKNYPEFNLFVTNLLSSGTLKEKRSRFKNKL